MEAFSAVMTTDRIYVDGKVDRFNGCDVDTWSLLWIEDFIKQLGYADAEKMYVYWLLLGKSMSNGFEESER